MLIRSILTIAVLGTFVFGAAANAETPRTTSAATVLVVADTSPNGDIYRPFASAGGLGTTR